MKTDDSPDKIAEDMLKDYQECFDQYKADDKKLKMIHIKHGVISIACLAFGAACFYIGLIKYLGV